MSCSALNLATTPSRSWLSSEPGVSEADFDKKIRFISRQHVASGEGSDRGQAGLAGGADDGDRR